MKIKNALSKTFPLIVLLFLSLILFECSNSPTITSTDGNQQPEQTVTPVPSNVIPMPVSDSATGTIFNLTSSTNIYIEPVSPELENIGHYLADKLNPSTGFGIQVLASSGIPPNGNIYITIANEDPALGEEGYKLTVTKDLVKLQANQPEGLFRGIQTIRQLLPPAIESSVKQPGPWQIETRIITDYPRYEWRGFMLDVARHFFPVSDVEKLIDLMAYYKMNRFHLHLSDDQGWRIMINSWPNLAQHGGSTAVDGDPGGYYTQAQYTEIVNYASARYITVIPEIDMPGHVNAALSSYAELNCSGIAPALYTGINVGFSSLCVDSTITYSFVNDVVKDITELTPGPYFHIGGDEASTLSSSDYINFVNKVQNIVQSYGKQMIGWEEISQANINSNSVCQYWANPTMARAAVSKGNKLIMSPSNKAYMDMKYNTSITLGQNWAGYINVQTAYNWEPAALITRITDNNILGIEAPLWTETIKNLNDIEYMVFPRLLAYSEIGWTPESKRNWDNFKNRLALQGPRFDAMGVNYYKSSLIPWATQ